MAVMNPSLSVIIPTRNRHEYLIPVVKTLVEQTNAEIIICDNSDNKLADESVDEFIHAGRVIYQHTTKKLSVVGNFKMALDMSSGDYLIFLGDDDCVGPGIEDIVQWAKNHDVEAVISYKQRFIANYFWPKIKSKYFGDGYAGKLFLRSYSGGIEKINGKSAIASVLKKPGTGLGSMVRAYHGVISRSLVQRVIEKYGHLFGGVSPDIFSATLLSYEVKKACAVDYPFVIPGASPKSTAGEGAAREDTDALHERDHIKRFGPSLRWDERIPAFYAPHTVWAYSQLKALEEINDPLYTFDFPGLYVRCAIHYPEHWGQIKIAFQKWKSAGGKGAVVRILNSLLDEMSSQVKRIYYRFFSSPREHADITDIGEAYKVLFKISGDWKNK